MSVDGSGLSTACDLVAAAVIQELWPGACVLVSERDPIDVARSAQLSEAMERDLGSLPELIAAGQEQQLRHWLAARVWPLGRSVNGEQLVQQVSGEPLSAAPFLRYLEEKVERLLSVKPG